MSQTSKSLLMQRKFLPFFITQFGGAFNDTLFKTTFTLLVTFYAGVYTTLSTAMAVNVISALFILPFVFVSSTAGQLADKLDKAVLMRGVKVFEVVILSHHITNQRALHRTTRKTQ